MLKESYIYLRDVRFHAFHGVMPQEKTVGADFTVNIRIGFDVSRAMSTDDVADTVSYADIYDILRREMDIPSRLIEHVAGRIAASVGATYPDVSSIMVSITKDNPPMGADCGGAGVEIHLVGNSLG